MKRSTQDYERPATSRFNPSKWEKSAVACEWVNCDPVAMYAVEGITELTRVDRHGYPAS
jgi:hypothetical protein